MEFSHLDDAVGCWTVEGELVFMSPIECGRGSVDDDCGCRRALAGMVSHRATTTIKVTRREELDPDTYFKLIADAHRDQGYVTTELIKDPEVNEWLRDITDELWPRGSRRERSSSDVVISSTYGEPWGRTRAKHACHGPFDDSCRGRVRGGAGQSSLRHLLVTARNPTSLGGGQRDSSRTPVTGRRLA
jgi:hypothetical protein